MHLSVYGVGIPFLSLWERWPSAARTERANSVCTQIDLIIQKRRQDPLSHLR